MAETLFSAEDGLVPPLRPLVAELFGTFALTFVASAGTLFARTTGTPGEPFAALAAGFTVLAMIYALGDVSGAHINPAVTFAFALRGAFPLRRIPGYWLTQLLGAVGAALLLRALFGPAGDVGAILPKAPLAIVLVMEVVFTLLLVSVIVATATENRLVGHNAGIAVGFTVALGGITGAAVGSGSMNPALSLGPALVAGKLATVWVYVVGPFVGAAIAVAVAGLTRGDMKRRERDTARGKARGR